MTKTWRWIVPLAAAVLAAILPPAGGQEVEATGNNLSFPVIWGEGSGLELRGSFGLVITGGAYTLVDGVAWWHQRDAVNTWQAEAKNWLAPTGVSWIDWGDNLESQDWKSTSKVRVETVLYKDLTDAPGGPNAPMLAYNMLYLSGSGQTEMWGSNVATYFSDRATVYSNHARLTIQRIDPALELVWDSVAGQWCGGGVLSTDFNGGCWQEVEGPGGYSAEINLPGKVIYGYNWDVLTTSLGRAGTYRITFSLDQDNGTGDLQTRFDETTRILPIAPEEGTALSLSQKPDGGKPEAGGTAFVRPDLNLTYIDVTIKAGGGGRR